MIHCNLAGSSFDEKTLREPSAILKSVLLLKLFNGRLLEQKFWWSRCLACTHDLTHRMIWQSIKLINLILVSKWLQQLQWSQESWVKMLKFSSSSAVASAEIGIRCIWNPLKFKVWSRFRSKRSLNWISLTDAPGDLTRQPAVPAMPINLSGYVSQ